MTGNYSILLLIALQIISGSCVKHLNVLSSMSVIFPKIDWGFSEEEVEYEKEFAVWSKWSYCPDQKGVIGFQLKTWSNASDQGGIVGIRFFCRDFRFIEPVVGNVTLDPVPWGNWEDPVICMNGVAMGYQVRMETPNVDYASLKGISDFAIYCSLEKDVSGLLGGNREDGGKLELFTKKPKAPTWGKWQPPQFCFPFETICKMRILYDPNSDDVSAIHKFELGCCNDIDVGYIEEYLSSNYHKRLPGGIIYTPVLDQLKFIFGENPQDYFFSFPHVHKEFDYPFWHNWHFCTFPEYIVGFKVKVGENNKIEGVKFLCSNPLNPSNRKAIGVGDDREFSRDIICPEGGIIVGLDVKYSSKNFIQNIRLFCSFSKDDEKKFIQVDFKSDYHFELSKFYKKNYHEEKRLNITSNFEIKIADHAVDDLFWVSGWIGPRFCPPFQAMCGFKINGGADISSEGEKGPLDLRMNCCEIQDPASFCLPQDRYEPVFQCNRPENFEGQTTCKYTYTTGYSKTKSSSKEVTNEKNLQENTRHDHNMLMRTSKADDYSSNEDVTYTDSKNLMINRVASLLRSKNSEVMDSLRKTKSETNMEEKNKLESILHRVEDENAKSLTFVDSQGQRMEKGSQQLSTQITQDEKTIRDFTSSKSSTNVHAEAGFSGFGVSVSGGVSHEESHDSGRDISNTQRNTNENTNTNSLTQSIDKSKSKSSEEMLKKRFEQSKTKNEETNTRDIIENTNDSTRTQTGGKREDKTFSVDEKLGYDQVSQNSRNIGKNERNELVKDISRGTNVDRGRGVKHSESWSESTSETWSVEHRMEQEYILQGPGKLKFCQLMGQCSFYSIKSNIVETIMHPGNCNTLSHHNRTLR